LIPCLTPLKPRAQETVSQELEGYPVYGFAGGMTYYNPSPPGMMKLQIDLSRYHKPPDNSLTAQGSTTENYQDQAAKQSRTRTVSASLPISS
jgi:hypothetical protein